MVAFLCLNCRSEFELKNTEAVKSGDVHCPDCGSGDVEFLG